MRRTARSPHVPAEEDPVWNSIHWPDGEAGPWRIGMKFDLVNGRVQAVGFSIEALSSAAPQVISRELLRSLPVATLLDRFHREYSSDLMRLVTGQRLAAAYVGDLQAAGLNPLDRIRGRPAA